MSDFPTVSVYFVAATKKINIMPSYILDYLVQCVVYSLHHDDVKPGGHDGPLQRGERTRVPEVQKS